MEIARFFAKTPRRKNDSLMEGHSERTGSAVHAVTAVPASASKLLPVMEAKDDAESLTLVNIQLAARPSMSEVRILPLLSAIS